MQPTRDCVAKTLKRLEEKIHGRVSFYFLNYLFSSSDDMNATYLPSPQFDFSFMLFLLLNLIRLFVSTICNIFLLLW